MRQESATPDAAVAALAAQQHGVLTIRQLRDAGLSDSTVSRYRRAGRLHRVHRGVYAVGHAGLSEEGRWMAAVLACGDSAVLSHWSAVALWRLLPRAPARVDVSVPGNGGRHSRPGIALHRSRNLTSIAIARRRAIPVTTPRRTIEDMRRIAAPEILRRIVRQAEVLGLRIESGVDVEGTRSELESAFLRLCRRHGISRPEVNVSIGSWLVDFVWRDAGLIVETDGYRYHRGRQAFEDDRRRDLGLRMLGYDVVRLTHDQVLRNPGKVAGAIEETLGRLRV